MHDLCLFDLPRELSHASPLALREPPDPLFDAFAQEPPRRPGGPALLRRPREPGDRRREKTTARTDARGPEAAQATREVASVQTPPARSPRGPERFAAISALALLASLAPAACAQEDAPELAPEAVLVQLRDPDRLPDWSRADEEGPPILALTPLGPDDEPPLFRVPVAAGAEPRAFAAGLARDPAVAFAEPVRSLRLLARTPDDPRVRDLWGLAAIGAPDAWERTVGDRAITVAVIDDGLALTHPDLAANLWTNPDELAGNGLDDDGDGIADDVHGASFSSGVASGDPSPDPAGSAPWHGTHASGIIGAVGENRVGVAGVNWRVSLMGVRAFGERGGRSDDLVQAIDYASSHGARVINASWGVSGAGSEALEQAIARAGARGALFVAAAGNDAAPAPDFPANLALDTLLSVGALDASGALAGFSNRGALLAAPGVGILSTSAPGSYERADGTSVAAPHVAGLAALLFAARPHATAAQVRAAILSSARALPGTVSGRIDAPRALAALEEMPAAGQVELVVSRSSLRFNAAPGATTAPAQVIGIRASNGEALALKATSSAAWAKTVHTLFTTPTRATIYVDPSRLREGEHSAEISFSSESGAHATIQISLHIGERERATARGEGCVFTSDGALHVERGALCTVVAPGLDEAASARSVSWQLPDGAQARGPRLTALFPRRGAYVLRATSGGETSSVAVQVE